MTFPQIKHTTGRRMNTGFWLGAAALVLGIVAVIV